MDDNFYIQKLDDEFHPDDPYAPERKVFYVDVGDMTPELAASYIQTFIKEFP